MTSLREKVDKLKNSLAIPWPDERGMYQNSRLVHLPKRPPFYFNSRHLPPDEGAVVILKFHLVPLQMVSAIYENPRKYPSAEELLK